MHPFSELVEQCAIFMLETLRAAHERVSDELQTSGATSLVKALQRIRLQKAVFAVGMLSLFEARLQDGLRSGDGFREASMILDSEGEGELKERFSNLILAVNVLKHGRGRSYDELIAKAEGTLWFRVRKPEEGSFCEGDVSEIRTLIAVDDNFVLICSKIIQEVSEVIRRARPEFTD